jgi:hypothetical protein
MQVNRSPDFDDSVNLTGCCARFNPEGWDGQTLHFKDKPFVRATTVSVAHVPLNMGRVFKRVQDHIAKAGAQDPHQMLVMSRELSAFQAEHLFAVTKPVPGEDMALISGEYLTKVFEGPFSAVGQWYNEMLDLAGALGKPAKSVVFFYTTCPKCATVYGQNPVVGLVET